VLIIASQTKRQHPHTPNSQSSKVRAALAAGGARAEYGPPGAAWPHSRCDSEVRYGYARRRRLDPLPRIQFPTHDVAPVRQLLRRPDPLKRSPDTPLLPWPVSRTGL